MPATAALIFAQVLLTQWVELKRLEDFKNPGSQADGSFFGITDDFKGVSNGCVCCVGVCDLTKHA